MQIEAGTIIRGKAKKRYAWHRPRKGPPRRGNVIAADVIDPPLIADGEGGWETLAIVTAPHLSQHLFALVD
jgi:hypothetical protein